MKSIKKDKRDERERDRKVNEEYGKRVVNPDSKHFKRWMRQPVTARDLMNSY